MQLEKLENFIYELRDLGIYRPKEILIAPNVYCDLIKEANDKFGFPQTSSSGLVTTFFGVVCKAGIDNNVIYQA